MHSNESLQPKSCELLRGAKNPESKEKVDNSVATKRSHKEAQAFLNHDFVESNERAIKDEALQF